MGGMRSNHYATSLSLLEYRVFNILASLVLVSYKRVSYIKKHVLQVSYIKMRANASSFADATKLQNIARFWLVQDSFKVTVKATVSCMFDAPI